MSESINLAPAVAAIAYGQDLPTELSLLAVAVAAGVVISLAMNRSA
jgi:hypothetical protein